MVDGTFKIDPDFRPARWLAMAVACILSACQQPVFLMPTPEVFRTGQIDIFATTPDEERSIYIPVLYATSRLPASNFEKNAYIGKYDENLRIGVASVQVGEDSSKNWDDLYAISTVEARDQEKIPLLLHDVTEYHVLKPAINPANPAAEIDELFADINEVLADSEDPDLLIFVHGANNSYSRSIAQGAQYRHFTGRRTAVLTFAWPSQAQTMRYLSDVSIATDVAPMLSELVELIAANTNVRYVNLLGYSLGAQIVSDALDTLRNTYPDEEPAALKTRLRIGEVYYAAADVNFARYVEQLQNYDAIVGRVSLTVNLNDAALGISGFARGASRAGRPDPDELGEEDTRWLIEASLTPNFDIIDIESAVAPYDEFKMHEYWYENPRVSTDILIQMLSHAPPIERGLERYVTPRGFEAWIFPENYQETAIAAVEAIRAARQ